MSRREMFIKRRADLRIRQEEVQERRKLRWGFLGSVEREDDPFEPSDAEWDRLFAILEEIAQERLRPAELSAAS